MHNEYIVTCCITDKREKLRLLEYASVDITNVEKELVAITLNLMDDCYRHTENFYKANKHKNTRKRYRKLEPFVVEQLKDMLFVKKKFIEYFNIPGPKTKEDLYIYIYAFQITDHFYNNYLYNVINQYLKATNCSELWDKYNLDKLEVKTHCIGDMYILKNTAAEVNIGTVQLNLEKSMQVLENYLINSNGPREEFAKIKRITPILDNYYDYSFSMPTMTYAPYREKTEELLNNLQVSIDLEKPKQFIKRR